MQKGYDGLFKRLSVERIEAEMRARQMKAPVCVNENLRPLLKHKDGRP